MAGLLKYHHHSNTSSDLDSSKDKGSSDLVQHRLCLIGLGVFLGQFLKALVPIDKVGNEAFQKGLILILAFSILQSV